MSPSILVPSQTLLAVCLLSVTLSCSSGESTTPSPTTGSVDAATTAVLTDLADRSKPVGEAGPAWLAADATLRAAFEEDYANEDDLRAVLARHVEPLGGAALLDFVEHGMRFCYEDGHVLGAVLYESTGDLAASLETCGTRCADGCMQGVVSAAFSSESYDALVGKLDSACSVAALEGYRPGSCTHGLGHALLTASGDDIARSLEGCSTIETPGLDYSCALGVFMGYVDTIKAKRLRGDSTARPTRHHPCDTTERYQAACYRYVMTEIRYRSSGRADHLVEECQELTGVQRRACFHGLGASFWSPIVNRPQTLTDVCGAGVGDERAVCVEGAIERLAEFDAEGAKALCASVEGDLAESCLGAVGGMYRLDKPTLALYRE